MANFKNKEKDEKKSESNAYNESSSKKDGTSSSFSNQKKDTDSGVTNHDSDMYDEDTESGSDYKSTGSFGTYSTTNQKDSDQNKKFSEPKRNW